MEIYTTLSGDLIVNRYHVDMDYVWLSYTINGISQEKQITKDSFYSLDTWIDENYGLID
jgi:hypothetical protein